MPIIGSLIKGIIDASQFFGSDEDHMENQEKVLIELLEKAKHTAFGIYYGFEEILEKEDKISTFQEWIPFFDYNKIQQEWWKQIQSGRSNITWPGRPSYFALSSGTTGKSSKRIPITEDMLESIRTTGLKQISAISNFDMPADFFEKEIMMLGSSTSLDKREDNLEEGEISEISASNIPFWFRSYYKPGREIADIQDWDERVKHIAQHAKDWDIGALSGIPSWMQLMLKEVIDFHEAENIHEIWPNLQVYTSGGVSFEPYEKTFNDLLESPITVIDTYLASEGFLAYQRRPETSAMQLVTDNGIFFEFVPFQLEYIQEDGSLKQDAPVKTIAEVFPDKDYVLLIRTVSGLWRYMIGYTISFTNVEKAEIKITGRTKFFMNVVGSQLSVNKMNDAVQELEEKYDINLPEFVLSAVKIDGEFYHKWYLGKENDLSIADEELAKSLDELLKKANKNYKVARSKALKGVIVKTIPIDLFFEWSGADKQKGGQVKIEKIMKEEKFQKFEKFIQQNQRLIGFHFFINFFFYFFFFHSVYHFHYFFRR